jgi:hypothetical protein
MNTRTAKDDSILHQSKFASSPEFERGLLGNLVAKRAALLESREDRALIWAIHSVSHGEGGLAALARELLARYGDRVGTPTMLKAGKSAAQNYSANEMRAIRLELPANLRHRFPLKGELKSEIRELRCAADNTFETLDSFQEMVTGEREQREKRERDEAAKHPNSYPVAALRDLCLLVAQNGIEAEPPDYPETPNLERTLAEMCLDPEYDFERAPWYFPALINTLREHFADLARSKSAASVITALGAKVCEVLEYTSYSRGLTLVQGNPRLGKSFAARAWCSQHLGYARWAEVPTGNDEASFFRALARGLGIGNFLKYKVGEIRERVESVLLTGDILLCLDEGQRLWGQGTDRYFQPGRINWLMAMANSNVPICVITTPQFLESQKTAEEKHNWSGAQLTGRIAHFESLPTDLEPSDLMAVAKAVLPEADSKVLRALATYARASARYLAAIDAIAKRARFVAMQEGRTEATTADVRKAMQDSVIPADSKLLRALEVGRTRDDRSRARRTAPVGTPVESPEATSPDAAQRCRVRAEVNAPLSRRANFTAFVPA